MNTLSSPSKDEIALADRIGGMTAAKWKLVEANDLKQHLKLWLFTNVLIVNEYREVANGEGKLVVALRNEANKFAAAETEARVGRPLREDNLYTSSRVAKILPFLFEDWPQSVVAENPVTGQTYGKSNPENYGNGIAILADVNSAFHGLPARTKDLLKLRFAEGLTFDELAEFYGISQPAAKKRVDVALKLLSDALVS
jgi:DNA-directed RNA polymerase specialized sigma24 family protein